MMRTDRYTHPTTRALDFGGGDKTEYLFAAGFGLIILLALILSINHYFGGGSGPDAGEAPSELHYWCVSCREQSVVDPESLYDPENPEEYAGFGGDDGPIQCPKCQREFSAIRMTECPKCHAYYVPEALKKMDDPRQIEEMYMMDIEYVCPECGTDRGKFYREKYGR